MIEYSVYIISFLVVIIIVLVYFLKGFYDYWIKPPSIESISYNDIQFKTGDLLLFKNYRSFLIPITHSNFSHVGVIVVIGGVPFVFEMVAPFAYVTPLKHKLMENEGIVYNYKKLLTPLDKIELNKAYRFLEKAENMTYRKWPNKMTTEKMDTSMVCSEFVFHFLKEIGVIDLSKFNGENILDYLNEMTHPSDNHEYDATKRITFFQVDATEYIKHIFEIGVNGMPIEEEKQKILNWHTF